MKKNEMKVGNTVYFYNKAEDEVCSGIIKKIFPFENSCFVKTDFMHLEKHCSKIYKTVNEACKEKDNWHKLQYTKYKSDIHNTEDLIKFMYENLATSFEHTDMDARKVARDCAKELLGINLNY